MELYREMVSEVPFKLPNVNGSQLISFQVFREGVLVPHFSPAPWREVSVNMSNLYYEWQLLIPFAATLHDGRIQLKITYRVENKEYLKVETHQVVTPYVNIDEWMSRFNGEKNLSEVVELERRVRGTIDNFCGQSFGLTYDTKRVFASGDDKLLLPDRLRSLESMATGDYSYSISGVQVTGDGWYIGYPRGQYTSIKQLPDNVYVNGSIYNPLTAGPNFRDDQEFLVKGLWGFDEVPGPVVTAAGILMEDYACDQASWRDKYIKTMKASDWNFTFSDFSFEGTGNVQADQLLSSFKRTNMVII